MEINRSAIKDIILSIANILLCASFIIESYNIRSEETGDPVGPAGVAWVSSLIIIVLSIFLGIRALKQSSSDSSTSDPTRKDIDEDADRTFVFWMLGLSFLYVLGFYFRVDFRILTILFLFFSISILNGFSKRSIVFASFISIVIGFGCMYLFTKVFLVDLPRW